MDKTGNQPSFKAKTYKSSKEMMKLGRLFPIKQKRRMMKSVGFPCFTAVNIPNGTENSMVSTTDVAVNISVFGNAPASFFATEVPST